MNFANRIIYKIFLLLVTILSVYGCNKNDDKELTPNVTPANLVLTSYPHTPGNSWKYHTEVRLTDSSGTIIDSTIYDNYWMAVSDTFINGIASTKFSQLDSNYTGSVHFANSYYANQTDGFYGMAVENTEVSLK